MESQRIGDDGTISILGIFHSKPRPHGGATGQVRGLKGSFSGDNECLCLGHMKLPPAGGSPEKFRGGRLETLSQIISFYRRGWAGGKKIVAISLQGRSTKDANVKVNIKKCIAQESHNTSKNSKINQTCY